MRKVYIFPIGGILSAIGVLVGIVGLWLWQTATEYQNALMDFANKSSDIVVMVAGGIALLLSIPLVILQYGGVDSLIDQVQDRSAVIAEAIVRAFLLATSFGMALSGMYAWLIYVIDAIIGVLAESFLMWISIPLLFLFGLAGIFVGCIPSIGLYILETKITEDRDEDNCYWRFIIPVLLEVAAILLYLFLITSCTDLPQYLANSFAA